MESQVPQSVDTGSLNHAKCIVIMRRRNLMFVLSALYGPLLATIYLWLYVSGNDSGDEFELTFDLILISGFGVAMTFVGAVACSGQVSLWISNDGQLVVKQERVFRSIRILGKLSQLSCSKGHDGLLLVRGGSPDAKFQVELFRMWESEFEIVNPELFERVFKTQATSLSSM